MVEDAVAPTENNGCWSCSCCTGGGAAAEADAAATAGDALRLNELAGYECARKWSVTLSIANAKLPASNAADVADETAAVGTEATRGGGGAAAGCCGADTGGAVKMES